MSLGCRACLKKNDKKYFSLQTVFLEYEDKSILDLLSFVTSSEVAISPNLPSVICQNCLKDLKVAYAFIKSFKNSQVFLQKYVQGCKKHISMTEDTKRIKEESLEHILNSDESDRILIVEDDESTFDKVVQEIFGSENIKQENLIEKLKGNTGQNSSHKVIMVSVDDIINSVKNEDEDNFNDSCKETSKFYEDQTQNGHIKEEEEEEEDEDDVYRKNIDKNNISDQDTIKISKDILLMEKNRERNLNNIQIVTVEDVLQLEKRKKEQRKTVLGVNDVLAIKPKSKKRRTQNEAQIFQCDICKSTFDTRRKLTLHKFRLHNPNWETKYKCEICGLKSRTMSAYIYHSHIHKNIRYTCKLCPKSYITRSKLKEHISRVHENKLDNKYLCPECGKGFKFSNALEYHMNKHRNFKNYICRFCGFASITMSGLTRHERTHTGERPYVCKYCEKTFAGAAERQKHMFGHEGVFPYKCKYCDKPFIQTYNMKVHWLQHTGRYVCELCKKSFAAPEILQFHYAHSHKIKDVVIDGELEKTEDEQEDDVIE